MKRIWASLLAACFGLTGFCQVVRYAPDLRMDDQIHSWLGFGNPGLVEATYHLVGYDADGVLVGERDVVLSREMRFEASVGDLFETGTPAWVSVSAEASFFGYVRYERVDGKGASRILLSNAEGNQIWLPQIKEIDGAVPATVLINASDNNGSAQSQPTISIGNYKPYRSETSTVVPDFGNPRGQTNLDNDTQYKDIENPTWDVITAEGGAQLAAVQHFLPTGDASGMASLTLPRTTSRELVFGALGDYRKTLNKVVLINTHAGPAPAVITTYNQWGQEQVFEVTLQAFDKLELDMNKENALGLPRNLDWMRVLPKEGGLLGYHLFGEDGNMGVLPGDAMPSTSAALPHTPTNNEEQTEIVFLNLDDDGTRVFVYGYDAAGKKHYSGEKVILKPGQKEGYSMEDLFGAKADSITWVKAATTGPLISAYSRVSKRDNSAVSVMTAAPVAARSGNSFFADFEHFGRLELENQGWQPIIFSDPDYWPPIPRHIPERYTNRSFHPAGSFFTETIYAPECGFFHIGYQSIYEGRVTVRNNDRPDSAAYMSPFFEAPDYAHSWLSFNMRFFNPLDATVGSRYGIVWREEGSNEWHWFGVSGELLLDPPFAISDCWFDIQYRNEIVTATGWLRFETLLPESVRGKRIQVGLHMHHIANPVNDEAPFVFMDSIRVSHKPDPHAINLGEGGYGVFTFEEAGASATEGEEQ